MTEQEALLDAIFADPADDLPRLAYADWLDEHGGRAQAARAEFIRLQLELARPPRDHARVQALTQRQMALWQAHGQAWWSGVPMPLRGGVIFRRGFIDEFRGNGRAFFQNSPDLFWKNAPAQFLALAGTTPAQVERLAGAPALARLKYLELSAAVLPVDVVQALVSSPHCKRLLKLSLHRLGADLGLVEVLVQSPLVAQLRALSLRANALRDPGVQRLVDSPAVADLAELDLSDNQIGHDGARALAASPYLERLTALHLGWNFIPNEAMAELRRRFGRKLQPGRQVL